MPQRDTIFREDSTIIAIFNKKRRKIKQKADGKANNNAFCSVDMWWGIWILL